LLGNFVNKLRNPSTTQPESSSATAPVPSGVGETLCALHRLKNCESCKDTFGQKHVQTDDGWMSHELKFEKKPIDPFARRDNVDDFVVLDPRVSLLYSVDPIPHLFLTRMHLPLVAREKEGQGAFREKGTKG